jgi:hypothetical protein
MKAGVSHQCTGKQTALTQYLEPVADAKNILPFSGELLYRSHNRRESRQRSGTQVIAVRKPAWDDQSIKAAEIGLLVPDKVHGLANML